MKGLVFIIALLAAAPAFATQPAYPPHGHKRYADDAGHAYKGGHYVYNGYTYRWEFVPDKLTSQYVYNYTWNSYGANQGASQQGLEPGAFYDQADIGALSVDSSKYVSAARSVDEKLIDQHKTASVQSAYTKDKVHQKFATAQSAAIIMDRQDKMLERLERLLSADGAGLEAFINQSATAGSMPEPPAQDSASALASAEAKCMRCHGGDAAQGNGFKLPSFAAADDGQREKIHAKLIHLDPSRNMAKRAQLSDAEYAAAEKATRTGQ